MKTLPSLSPLVAALLGVLMVALPWGVGAQQVSTSLPGITVLGHGEASAPAETATIVLMVSADVFKSDPPVMEGTVPAQPATPTPDEMAAPVVDALVAAGVPAGEIELIRNPYTGDYGPYGGPVNVTIRFGLEDPSTEGISALLDAAIAAARENGYYLTMMGAIYGVADCQPLLREARQAAIADARAQALVQAELLGVGMGEVVASRDDPYTAMMYGAGMQVNSCTLAGQLAAMSSLYSAPPFDPAISPQVTVSTHLEITFAIGDEPATPAP